MHPMNSYGSSLICWRQCQQGESSVISISDELLIHIFSNFKFNDTVCLSLVCKKFAKICQSNNLWKFWMPGCPLRNTLKEYNQYRGMTMLRDKIERGVSGAFRDADPYLVARLPNFMIKLIGDKLSHIETEYLMWNIFNTARPAFRIHLNGISTFMTSKGLLRVPAIFCVKPLGESLYIYRDLCGIYTPSLRFDMQDSKDMLDLTCVSLSNDGQSFVMLGTTFSAGIFGGYGREVNWTVSADEFLNSIIPIINLENAPLC